MLGKIQEINTDYGRIEVTLLEDSVMLTGYRGKDISLTIPELIENKPVTVIGKKAFLGAKSLQELYLPESISTIQEWAFASCSSLEKLSLPRKELS
ncbi:MAG: leucine-rich repeat domain-containing protein, partial [Lachnospiraceae bacterium]|nr:leucine-rich repeat domain-containing protein [Lachnospiraceae bacterium]